MTRDLLPCSGHPRQVPTIAPPVEREGVPEGPIPRAPASAAAVAMPAAPTNDNNLNASLCWRVLSRVAALWRGEGLKRPPAVTVA